VKRAAVDPPGIQSERSRRAGARLALFGIPTLWAAVACGGGLPLLHPAQTLDPGQVRAAAGFSANMAAGALADALRASTHGNATPGADGDEATARAALVEASVAPGIAPLAGARVGFGQNVEGGLTYTGRGARADVRRSFDLSRTWAVSLGVAGSAVLAGQQSGESVPDVDLETLHGWGADAPLLVGYESDGGLYAIWVGVRGGFEHVGIAAGPSEGAMEPSPPPLSAMRWWGGGLLGAAIGFRHVHVALELDVSYASVTGDFAGAHTHIAGLMLTPAGCAWWDF
jgi:hypothetical protein